METMELQRRAVRAALNDAKRIADEKCKDNDAPGKYEAMTQLVLACRAVKAEEAVKKNEAETKEAHKACAAASARARVAEQCRDAADAKAAGWRVLALSAAVAVLLLGLSADTNRREAEYWKGRAQSTQAQPSIARVERDTELGRAVVWYK